MTDSADRPSCIANAERISPPRHRWVRLAITLAAVAGLWLVHGFVLRGLARLLVRDEPTDQFQYVGLMAGGEGPDGDQAYAVAAALFQQHPSCRFLLIQPAATRLVETGVLPSFAALSRRELAARGVPPCALLCVPSDGHDDWAIARALRAWLADHQRASVVLLCGRLRSAYVRHVLNVVLDSSQAAQVRLRAARPPLRRNQLVDEPRRL